MDNPVLDPRIEQSLRKLVAQLAKDGEVLSRETLEQSYRIFRERFGI